MAGHAHLLRGERGLCRAPGLRSMSAAAAVKGAPSRAARRGGDRGPPMGC